MAVKGTAPISFVADIVAEFGGTVNHTLTEYYRGGTLVPDITENANIPTSGEVSITDYYNGVASVNVYTSRGANVAHMVWIEMGGSHTILAPGYNGVIDVFLCGRRTADHINWRDEQPYDNGTGELAYLQYQCTGSETSFSVTQSNLNHTTVSDTWHWNSAYATFAVSNGRIVRFGSGRGQNPNIYGLAGRASLIADDTAGAGFTFQSSGAHGGDQIRTFYSDDTDYDFDGPGTSGSPQRTVRYPDRSSVTLRQATWNTRGIRYHDRTTDLVIERVAAGLDQGTDSGVLLVYRNEH